jgi:hypothetical protein
MGHKCSRPSFETPRKRAAPQSVTENAASIFVMDGLVPAIHVFLA